MLSGAAQDTEAAPSPWRLAVREMGALAAIVGLSNQLGGMFGAAAGQCRPSKCRPPLLELYDFDCAEQNALEVISMLSDKTLRCVECGSDFNFTVGEQEFFASRGFTNEPTRCPQCRAARRSQQGGSGGSGGFGGAPREMHPAVCAQCGADTMVPFRPRGDRPVYCSDCFSSMRR